MTYRWSVWDHECPTYVFQIETHNLGIRVHVNQCTICEITDCSYWPRYQRTPSSTAVTRHEFASPFIETLFPWKTRPTAYTIVNKLSTCSYTLQKPFDCKIEASIATWYGHYCIHEHSPLSMPAACHKNAVCKTEKSHIIIGQKAINNRWLLLF